MRTDAPPSPLRLAMLGMVEGNGHPYSWSAIFNGYDRVAMAACPYPVIPEYLGRQPETAFPMPGARVTHVWTDDPADAEEVARCARIPNVAGSATDVIDEVDAVIIATDRGDEHVARCRPFIEAGLPVFVDKPLVDRAEDLEVFREWIARGARVLSSSCMRYAREFVPYHRRPGGGAGEGGNRPASGGGRRLAASAADGRAALGELRYASISMCKSWERYGIHALEAIYPITGPGFLSCRNTGSAGRDVVHLKHRDGTDASIGVHRDAAGAFGSLQLCGTEGAAQLRMTDTFAAFHAQLADLVRWLQSGTPPFPFAETEELMKLVIAAIVSRNEGGREVQLREVA